MWIPIYFSHLIDVNSHLIDVNFTYICKNSHLFPRIHIKIYWLLYWFLVYFSSHLPGFSFLHLGNFMKVMIWLPPEIRLSCKNYTSGITVSHWFYKVSCQCKNTLPKRCVRNGFPYFFLNFSPQVLQKHKICLVLEGFRDHVSHSFETLIFPREFNVFAHGENATAKRCFTNGFTYILSTISGKDQYSNP